MIKRTEFDNRVDYTLDGKFHREDGPAVEFANGNREWWINGIQVEPSVRHFPEEKRKTESEDLIYKSPLEPGQKYLLCTFPAADHVLDYEFLIGTPSLTVDGKIVVPSRSVFRVVNQFRGALSSCPQNQCGKVIHIRLQGLFTPDKTVEVDREGNFYYYGPTDGEIFIDGDNQF